jgi:acetylornithine deacetylase/succinyl-diaminopimelate desuccinylase family protein
MILDTIELLEQLVAIPSVNPMGRDSVDPTFGEGRLTDFLEKTFARIGLPTWRQNVSPDRDNLIARLDGDPPPERGGLILLLDAHQDTVPVEGMTIEPFRPRIADGRLYGRGACDVKGGMAAILAAVSWLAHEKPCPRPTVLVSCTVNEEFGFSGAERLTQLWGSELGKIIPRRPDAIVVAEPTGLDVVVAHKGVIRWKCHARGRAAHGACPEAGINAIYEMARAVAAIEQYAASLCIRGPSHPLCGPATVNVGTIHGGISVNTVPDRSTIEIDHRVPPGEDVNAARQRLIDYLGQAAATAAPLEHESPMMAERALSDRHNRRLAEMLAGVVRKVAGNCRLVGAAYATDAAMLSAEGIPTVVFGPGFVEQAHTVDEWISVEQLGQATEVLRQLFSALSSGTLTA